MAATARGPLPLLIGATGHRDLPDDPKAIAKLEAAVEGILSRLQRSHPHTPIVVATALADGADQLIGRVARRLGLALLVPLPMPREVYETTIADRAQFASLLEGADAFTLPMATGNTLEKLKADTGSHALQYGVLAAFLARQCHGLVALWDGVRGTRETELMGGTAQVVRFHRSGVPPPLVPARYPADPVDRGPTWHVVTPRAGKTPPRDAFDVHVLLPGKETTEPPANRERDRATSALYEGIRERIDTFNADALMRQGSKPALPTDATCLVPASAAASLPRHVHETAARHALVDALANAWQRRAYRALDTLPWFALLAVVFLQAYADWLTSRWLLTAYVVALGMAWAFFWITLVRPRAQDRYQDYRALAEGLRVEFFCQANDAPGCAADHYLGRQRSELDWIRQALRAWTVTSPAARAALLSEPPPARREPLAMAREHWIASQAAYHARVTKRDASALHWWERRRTIAFLVSVFVAVAAAAAVQVAPEHSWLREAFDSAGGHPSTRDEILHALLVSLVAFPAIVAGFVEYYCGRRAFAEHAHQYERMAADLELLRDRLDVLLDAGELEAARRHLLDVAEISLAEHGDWLLLHRERPINVPQGG